MLTYTQLINKVLRKLREDEVAGPTSSAYATLIGDMVNEAKREVEDAWKWTALRQTIQITTVDGTQEYSVTGSGQRFKLQDPTNSVYDTTNLHRLVPANAAWVRRALLENAVVQIPSYYYFEGVDANGDAKINFYSIPDGAYDINIDLVVPQEDFSVGTEVLSIPDWPVFLGAYAKAVDERGEDHGTSIGKAFHNYANAISDAIAIDESLTVGESTWHV